MDTNEIPKAVNQIDDELEFMQINKGSVDINQNNSEDIENSKVNESGFIDS